MFNEGDWVYYHKADCSCVSGVEDEGEGAGIRIITCLDDDGMPNYCEPLNNERSWWHTDECLYLINREVL